MMVFGNIVTRSKSVDNAEYFNIVGSYDEIDNGLPTMIVGYEEAKKVIHGLDIYTKRYGDVFWTFSKTERRCEYEDDMEGFFRYAVEKKLSDAKYVHVDILRYGLESLKKVVRFAKDRSKKIVFLTKGSSFMFVYSEKYNTVFGVSLSTCEYAGVPKQKVVKLLRNCEFVHGTSFISPQIRKVVGFNTHYIPILYGMGSGA